MNLRQMHRTGDYYIIAIINTEYSVFSKIILRKVSRHHVSLYENDAWPHAANEAKYEGNETSMQKSGI